MRIASFVTRVKHVIVELGSQSIPGIMVDGPVVNVGKDNVVISNFFLPVVGCDLVLFEDGISSNGDAFSIANQVGLFETPEGGIVLAPSDEFNDYALVFFEFINSDKILTPKEEGPDLIKRIEYENTDTKSEIYMMIIKKNGPKKVISFTKSKRVLEYSFDFDYLSGEVGYKVRKL